MKKFVVIVPAENAQHNDDVYIENEVGELKVEADSAKVENGVLIFYFDDLIFAAFNKNDWKRFYEESA